MYSSWLTDLAAIFWHAENHGLAGYLATIAVLILGLVVIVPKRLCGALLAGYHEARRKP